MNYSDHDIARQLRLGEDSLWEFKQIAFSGNRPTSPRRDDLADEIAAFANTDGGILLCGVSAEGAADPPAALEKMGLLSRSENGFRRATVVGMMLCNPAPEAWLPSDRRFRTVCDNTRGFG